MKVLGRHHIRSNFYHLVSLVFVISMTLWYYDIISDYVCTVTSLILFVTDYVAHMFDPHPEAPGPWWRRYFHRAFDGGEDCGECDECMVKKLSRCALEDSNE